MANLDMSHVAVTGPPRPSKWDIIPIHNSDRATFKECRRKWAWSSPSRANLIPKASIYGVQEYFWFGTGIHHALERYYNPQLREDPDIAFATWFNLQWLGGIVSEDEVSQFVDRDPQLIHANERDNWDVPTYKVAGLCDILYDPDTEEKFLAYKELGIGMMKYYKNYAETHDNFNVILVEHDFSVPILDTNGAPMYAVDKRKMPEGWEPDLEAGNEFGPLMKFEPSALYMSDMVLWKQVHVRGRMDQIIQELDHGRYGIRDYKTASSVGPDYFRHLDLDEQCTSYLAFGELEAKLHGLEHQQLEYIEYQALLKAYPTPPSFTTKGLPSINRQTESTTAEMFEKAIQEHGLTEVFNVDEKLQAYYTWLLQNPDRFIVTTPTWRNKTQRKNAMIRAYYEAMDMLNDPIAYPNPRKDYSCINCVFRVPCIMAEDGSDFITVLEDGYIPNWDR